MNENRERVRWNKVGRQSSGIAAGSASAEIKSGGSPPELQPGARPLKLQSGARPLKLQSGARPSEINQERIHPDRCFWRRRRQYRVRSAQHKDECAPLFLQSSSACPIPTYLPGVTAGSRRGLMPVNAEAVCRKRSLGGRPGVPNACLAPAATDVVRVPPEGLTKPPNS